MLTSEGQWICPRCGRRLRVANQEHTCGHFESESHFDGKDPVGRLVFEWILQGCETLGVLDVLPMKSMIGCQARSNFAFVKTRRTGVELNLLLTGPVDHPLVTKIDPYGPLKNFYRFRIRAVEDLDNELASLLERAYRENS